MHRRHLFSPLVKVGPQINMLENLGFTSCIDGWFRLSKMLSHRIGGERIFRWSLNGERFLDKTFHSKCSDGTWILHLLTYCWKNIALLCLIFHWMLFPLAERSAYSIWKWWAESFLPALGGAYFIFSPGQWTSCSEAGVLPSRTLCHLPLKTLYGKACKFSSQFKLQIVFGLLHLFVSSVDEDGMFSKKNSQNTYPVFGLQSAF